MKAWISLSLTLLLVAGCGSRGKTTRLGEGIVPMATLQSLSNKNKPVKTKVGDIRAMALKETAISLGARYGLAWQAKHINKQLKQNEQNLSRVFNFPAIMLGEHVLPPVLTEGDQTLNMDNDRTLRLSDKTYKIEQQARFVTAPPNWRGYLWLDYQIPEAPDVTLLPKNAEEQQIWAKSVKEGWFSGIHQANTIFTSNLARLKNDFSGMVLYRKLLSEKIVSAPAIAKANLGVTGDKDQLAINDQVLRLTDLPNLITNTKDWNPVLPHGQSLFIPE